MCLYLAKILNTLGHDMIKKNRQFSVSKTPLCVNILLFSL